MYNRKDFWQLSETKGLGHGTADFQAKKKKSIKENKTVPETNSFSDKNCAPGRSAFKEGDVFRKTFLL